MGRDEVPDLVDEWLLAEGDVTVEPPLVEELPAPEGTRLTRSLVYSRNQPDQLVVGVRYVVETGHPECVVLAHAASHDPAEVLPHLDVMEDFLRTCTLHGKRRDTVLERPVVDFQIRVRHRPHPSLRWTEHRTPRSSGPVPDPDVGKPEPCSQLPGTG